MASSIIHGKHLVKRARGDSSEVITDGAFYQKDGRIIDVGPYRDLKSRHPGETDVGGASVLVILGVVNAAIGAAYYLRIIMAVYMGEEVERAEPTGGAPGRWGMALGSAAMLIVYSWPTGFRARRWTAADRPH